MTRKNTKCLNCGDTFSEHHPDDLFCERYGCGCECYADNSEYPEEKADYEFQGRAYL